MLRIALAVVCVMIAGCDLSESAATKSTVKVPGGDAARGREIVVRGNYGCTACHTIPGIDFPRGTAGPPLAGMAQRAFIAGQLPNKPDVLVAFLMNPPRLVPKTAMPDVRLSLDQARDVAAFLYTLEARDAP